jgi:ribosome biogenesis protein SSF1/2
MKTAGVSKSVKRVVQTKLPNLSNYKDISEYVLKESGLSESEAEDNDESLIPASALGQSAKASVQKRIKLIELGPRMTLNLTKIQDNLCGGEVLYHAFVSKSEEDLKKQKVEHERKQKEKEQRKLEQEKNVEKKKLAAEEHKKRCAPDTGFEEENEEEEEDRNDIAEDAEDFDGSDFGEESDYSEVESDEEDDDDKESEDEVYGTSEGEEELGDESEDD